MKFFINLFLILYLLDGEVSLVDEVLSLTATSNLTELRGLLANLVLIISLPMYLSLGFDRRLPKQVFMPLTLFVLWCPLSVWFFPSLAGIRIYGLILALLQILLFLLPVAYIRKRGGESPLMTEEVFSREGGSTRSIVLFWGANLVLIPVTIVCFALTSLNAYLMASTAGFMQLRPGGLYMTEKVYRGEGKTVRLVAMIHVGEKEYYEGLVRSINSPRTVVLAEGVTDRKNLLKTMFGYGKMAGYLGLTSQEEMRLKGRFLEVDEGKELEPSRGAEPDIVRADVDLSTFQPTTIYFLNVLGRYLAGGTSLVKQGRAFYQWAEKNVTPEMNQVIMNDILHKRNQEVVGQLGKVLPLYDTVVIPWGALHMVEIEEAVRRRGFVLQEKRETESIDFPSLILHKLRSERQ